MIKSTNIIRLVLISLFIVFYIHFNARPIMIENSKFYNILMKILINHLQRLSIIGYGNMKSMLDDIQTFFSFLNGISFLSEDNFSNDCYMQALLQIDLNDLYLYKTLFIVLLPLIISYLSLLIYASFNLRIRWNVGKKYSIMFFTSIFLFYPLITKCSVSLLNCFKLNDETTEEFLFASPNVKCWQDLHLYFTFFIGGFGILVWGIGFPLFLKLYLHKKQKNVMPNKSFDVYGVDSSKVEIIKKQENSGFSFFVKDYKTQFYYWESMIFTQKFVLILVQNVQNIVGLELQDNFFLLILFIYFFLLMKSKPFKINLINILEEFALMVTIFTKIFLVFISYFSENFMVLYIFFCGVICFNVSFFILASILVVKLTDWRILFSSFFNSFRNLRMKFTFSHAHKKKAEFQFTEKRKI